MTAVAEGAAGRFLQTALVVDDNAFTDLGDGGEATLGDESLEDYSHHPSPAGPAAESGATTERDYDTPLDSQAVVEGFADRGVACVVMQPDGPSDIDLTRVRTLARRTDVVVLDWLLRAPWTFTDHQGLADSSGTSLELIEEIIREDVLHGGRLRLICVYTATPGIGRILERISLRLTELGPELAIDPRIDAEGMAISCRDFRVLILRKPRRREWPAEQLDAADDPFPVVNEVDLADRLVTEFVAFAGVGLLPNLALAAVAGVRDNTHRLLARFQRELDPALITHRALTDSDAVEGFAAGLVSDELASLASTVDVSMTVNEPAILGRIDELLDESQHQERWFRRSPSNDKSWEITRDEAKEILRSGLDAKARIMAQDQWRDLDNPSVSSLCATGSTAAEAIAEGDRADDEFSILSTLASSPAHYGQDLPAPRLRLGTVVRSRATDKFFVCLQPVCDSIRLRHPVKFPLLPLTAPNSSDPTFDIVISSNGSPKRLRYLRRFRDVEMVTFAPTANMDVASTWASPGVWLFSTEPGADDWEWLGELRRQKATQIALRVATSMGRVGLGEYEYLRLMNPKS